MGSDITYTLVSERNDPPVSPCIKDGYAYKVENNLSRTFTRRAQVSFLLNFVPSTLLTLLHYSLNPIYPFRHYGLVLLQRLSTSNVSLLKRSPTAIGLSVLVLIGTSIT